MRSLVPTVVQAVVPSPWVRIDADNDRIGDIGVYLGGLLDDLNLPDQVPDLIFEFVSPSKKTGTATTSSSGRTIIRSGSANTSSSTASSAR